MLLNLKKGFQRLKKLQIKLLKISIKKILKIKVGVKVGKTN